MAMVKVKVATTLFIMALLFISTLTCYAARPQPGFDSNNSPANTQQGVDAEDSCEGVGEEECLARRTLAAHLDYIYTQKRKP